MPLRDGGTFSPAFQGTIEVEIGSYAIDMQQMRAGEDFKHLIRVDGLGEFAISEQVFQQMQQQLDNENLTPTERTLAILGKALELGCQKVWSAPNRR
jgi:hypothetical protein